MVLKERLAKDLLDALRSRDETRKTTLRLALAAMKNAEIDKGGELDDKEAAVVISRQVKQRRESIAQFAQGGREDLVAQESEELEILLEYLPSQLSEEEIAARVHEVIEEVGATSLAQIGQVMRALMPQLKGKADGQVVNRIVKETLSHTE
jgi:uncharacterized protein YqeY